MEVKELRIGNLVRSCYSELGIMSITAISEDILKSDKREKIWVKSLIGIELTEDWLLEFGFELQSENDDFKNFITPNVFAVMNHFKKGGFFLDNIVGFGNKIKYIHQLQNLYFALTGEELTIK